MRIFLGEVQNNITLFNLIAKGIIFPGILFAYRATEMNLLEIMFFGNRQSGEEPRT